jgi:hypothetical protein
MKPVKILGAGPAGLTAAIVLAQAGRDVIVYEQAADVGTHHAGDPEAVENWTLELDWVSELAGWGLAKNFVCAPICEGTWFGPSFRNSATVRDNHPLFYLVLRGPLPGSLDRGLLAQAQKASVEVRFSCPIEPSLADIVCGGAPRPRAYGIGYNFGTSMANGAYICYDDRLTPKAFSYMAVCEGYGSVIAVAFVPARGLKEKLPDIVKGFRSRLDFDMQSPRYFSATVGFNVPQHAKHGSKPHAGEAGGFQDLFAGFGLRMAITTGYLAARSLLDGINYNAASRELYWPMMQTAAANRWLQGVCGNVGYEIMLRYLRRRAAEGRSMMRRHYQPSWYTRLLWPFAYQVLKDFAQDTI